MAQEVRGRHVPLAMNAAHRVQSPMTINAPRIVSITADTPSNEASSTAPRGRAPGGQSNHLVVPCSQYMNPTMMRVAA